MVIRRNPYRLFSLLVVALAISSVLFLIANLKNIEVGGEGSDWSDLFLNISELLVPLALTIWGMVLLFTVYNYLKNASMKKTRIGLQRSKINYLGIFGFLTILGLIMAVSSNLGGNLGGDGGSIDDPSNGGTDESGLEGAGGGSMLLTMLVMGVTLAVPILLYLYGRNIFIRKEVVRFEDGPKEVVEEAIARIRRSTGDDLRDAVIQSYADMVDLVQGRIEGEEMLTPQEFARAAVLRLGWPSGPVGELTQVFEEARYSRHALTKEHKDRALSGLERIRSEIGSGGERNGTGTPATL